MSNIKLGSHVGMAGKEMFLASAKDAVSPRAPAFLLNTKKQKKTKKKRTKTLKKRRANKKINGI